MAKILKNEDSTMSKPDYYGLIVNLDERGQFYADVCDLDGTTVFEIKSDEEEGGIWLIDDGYMKHKEDVSGLQDYLVEMEVIPAKSSVFEAREFERKQAKYERGDYENSPEP